MRNATTLTAKILTALTSAAAALAATALAAPAFAGRPEAPATAVRYADLDLSRGGDVARLQHRVAMALERVCGSYAGADPVEAQDIAHCRADASARARPIVAMLIARERATDLAQR